MSVKERKRVIEEVLDSVDLQLSGLVLVRLRKGGPLHYVDGVVVPNAPETIVNYLDKEGIVTVIEPATSYIKKEYSLRED